MHFFSLGFDFCSNAAREAGELCRANTAGAHCSAKISRTSLDLRATLNLIFQALDF